MVRTPTKNIPNAAKIQPKPDGIERFAVETAATGTIIFAVPLLPITSTSTLPAKGDINQTIPSNLPVCPATAKISSETGEPSSPNQK